MQITSGDRARETSRKIKKFYQGLPTLQPSREVPPGSLRPIPVPWNALPGRPDCCGSASGVSRIFTLSERSLTRAHRCRVAAVAGPMQKRDRCSAPPNSRSSRALKKSHPSSGASSGTGPSVRSLSISLKDPLFLPHISQILNLIGPWLV